MVNGPEHLLFPTDLPATPSATIAPLFSTPNADAPTMPDYNGDLQAPFAPLNSTALTSKNQNQTLSNDPNLEYALSFITDDQRTALANMVQQIWQQQPEHMKNLQYNLQELPQGQVPSPQMLSQQIAALQPTMPFTTDPSALPAFDSSLIQFDPTPGPSLQSLENNSQRLQETSSKVDELGHATDMLQGDVSTWLNANGYGDQFVNPSAQYGDPSTSLGPAASMDGTGIPNANNDFDLNSIWTQYPDFSGIVDFDGGQPANGAVDAVVERVNSPSATSAMSTESNTGQKKRKADEGSTQPTGRAKRKK